MARPTHLKEALNEESPLRDLVETGMGAFTRGHGKLIAEEQRSRIGDSLDLDAASKSEHPQANRWDYIISIPDLQTFAGIEPHRAKDDEITVVIQKKEHADEYLRSHLRHGCRITKWFWVTEGRVSFSKMDRAHRRLDQRGVKFVGRVLHSFD